MLTSTVRTQLALAGAVAVSVVWMACSSDGTSSGGREVISDSTAPASATPVATVPAQQATPAVPSGFGIAGQLPQLASLRAMVEAYQIVVVGATAGEPEPYRWERYPGQTCPLVYWLYPVKIEAIIHAGANSLADQITVALLAGNDQQPCDSPSGNQPDKLDNGQRYLFFLEDAAPLGLPAHGGVSPARFPILEGNLVGASGGEFDNVGPREISGATAEQVASAFADPDPDSALDALAHVALQDAVSAILRAIAEAPLPAPPYTTPTPTHSPSEDTLPPTVPTQSPASISE